MVDEDRGSAARGLVARETTGILGTLSQKFEGWPFGSLAPYALAPSGAPILLLSEIAEHTRNLRRDPRTSLFVHDAAAADDPQAGGRVTLLGYAAAVPGFELEAARRLYLERFPSSESYFAVHDFTLFTLRLVQVRFIGGFGRIYWLEPWELLTPADPLGRHARGILEHMNADHAESLVLYCRAFAGIEAASARMIAIDAHGFEVAADLAGAPRIVRVDFPAPVATPGDVRSAMIDLLAEARKKSGRG